MHRVRGHLPGVPSAPGLPKVPSSGSVSPSRFPFEPDAEVATCSSAWYGFNAATDVAIAVILVFLLGSARKRVQKSNRCLLYSLIGPKCVFG